MTSVWEGWCSPKRIFRCKTVREQTVSTDCLLPLLVSDTKNDSPEELPFELFNYLTVTVTAFLIASAAVHSPFTLAAIATL